MRNKILPIVLALIIIGVIGITGYIVLNSRYVENFTEFYMLNLEGKANDYPSEIKVGEYVEVIIGVINHENDVMRYRLDIKIDGADDTEITGITLENDEKWEESVGFSIDKSGNNQKVEFIIYENEGIEPYLEPLYLFVNVTD